MATRLLVGLLRRGLPNLSVVVGAVLDGMVLTGGTLGQANDLARHLGLANRFALVRRMHREGLPGVRELASWITMLGWVVEAEKTGASLFEIALRGHRCPAACYRLAKRMTGHTWTELRERGSRWLLERLEKRCREIGARLGHKKTRTKVTPGQALKMS